MKPHRTTATWIKRIALVTLVVSVGSSVSSGQTSAQSQSTQYQQFFLDHPPAENFRASLPPNARNVFVAKIRITQGPIHYMDAGGFTPPRPKYGYYVEVVITDVRSGNASLGAKHKIEFCENNGMECTFPLGKQLAREHYIVAYDVEGERKRMLGFPISLAEYNAWHEELVRSLRSLRRP